jgi:flagellar basal-body rod protein FlgB
MFRFGIELATRRVRTDERNMKDDFKNLLSIPRHSLFMSVSQPDLITVAEMRLAWASQRQEVLARNIANLSTPGFQATDLPDFQQALTASGAVRPMRTDPRHLEGTVDAGMAKRSIPNAAIRTTDRNGVRLEEQLMKVADTEMLNATVTAIFKKYMTMFNEALGKSS